MPSDAEAIAIVGMACRFPEARTPAQLFDNLLAGLESVGPAAAARRAATWRADAPSGVLPDVDLLDAGFFGLTPREAEAMDPQQRMLLEVAAEALQGSGQDGDGRRVCGVFAGVGYNRYYLDHVLPSLGVVPGLDPFRAMLTNEKDFLTTQIAYKLDLTGPCMTVQTGCSTSLVAVATACEALLNHQCDVALAGGVSVDTTVVEPGSEDSTILAADGHCRAFDAKANGTVGSSGAGIVVLKRLSDARADGDHVHAVILAAALNNDGARKVGFTAPSVEGQAEVIAEAHALAGITADSVTFVEAHGTGTALGDPIEVAALTKAFRASTTRTGYCALGAVKTNIGHADAAAGVASLIKTALALERGLIPPTLHFQSPNPALNLDTSPFYVNTATVPWPSGAAPRRAGVSSFGMGGTNVHLVLEEAPPARPAAPDARPQLLVLSAKTPTALDAASAALADHLEANPGLALADVAHTLQEGRRRLPHRRALACRDRAEAVAALRGHPTGRGALTQSDPTLDRRVAFLFSGQGAQHVGMGRDLYGTEPVFRAEVDRCASLLRPHLGLDLRDLLYPAPGQEAEAARQLGQTAFTQPALFVVEHALTKLWSSWGVEPAAMLGHSLGEYAAACAAGVFSLEDALALVALRGRLMQELPRGAMLAVPLPEAEVLPLLEPGLSVAAVNAPGSCVVSGEPALVDRLAAALQARQLETRPLAVSHAFHSAMMDPILPRFEALVRSIPLSPPRIPYVSNLTGDWVKDGEATDPTYWVRHLRHAVRFADGAARLLQDGSLALLEVGPGRTLCSLAARQVPPGSRPIVASLRHADDAQRDDVMLREAAGRLWLAGTPIDWRGLHASPRRIVALPTYPFERQRYWLTPPRGGARPTQRSAASREQTPPEELLYVPVWKRSLPPRAPSAHPDPQRWLVFTDELGLGNAVADRLAAAGHDLVRVRAGAAFTPRADGWCELDPRRRDDYLALAAWLRDGGRLPTHIAHFWSVAEATPLHGAAAFDRMQDLGFYSLAFLTQAFAVAPATRPKQVVVVSSQVQDVTGDEPLDPARSTLLGPARVLPQEYIGLVCRAIDVDPSRTPLDRLADQMLAELLAAEPRDTVLAYRGPHCWTQAVEPVRLPPGPHARPPLLRPEGTYLITGGLGGVGLTLAEHLARTLQARLVLTGRSGLPPRPEWAAWLASHPANDRTSAAIRKVEALEALGAKVLVCAADVADPAALRAAIAAATEAFGRIHGVIHAAGAIDEQLAVPLAEVDRAGCERQFRPKAHGLLCLQEAFAASPPDVLVAISSLAAFLGGDTFGPYASANLYLDATARRQARGGYPIVSINWDGWKVTRNEEIAKEHPDLPLLTPAQGTACFDLALGLHAPQVMVVTGDFAERIRRWIDLPQAEPAAAAPAAAHPRPRLQSAFVAPSTPTETALAQVWKELLGFDEVGVQDDFFELGGHSLLATRVASRVKDAFGVELPVRSLFATPTIQALAAAIDALGAGPAPAQESAIRPVPRTGPLPLSFAQQRLWFLDQWEPQSSLYNLPFTLLLSGALDVPALERSLGEIVRRHEALRTTFSTVDGQPAQTIQPHRPATLPIVDLGGLPEAELAGRAQELVRAEAERPFDLVQGPVHRFCLVRLGAREHLLLVTFHHVAYDAWSNGVFLRELATAYQAFTTGRIPQLPELAVQYADFAHWQRRWLEGSGELQGQVDYWRKQLQDLPALDLPTDRPRPAIQRFHGARLHLAIPPAVTQGLKALALQQGGTVFMPLLAAFQALLARYTGQDDIAVGSPIAGRNRRETEELIGFFVNTLVLRTSLAGNPTFRDLVGRVRETCLGAYAHQDVPFEKLVEELQPERDLSRSPLFQVTFALQNAPGGDLALPGLKIAAAFPDLGLAKFDLVVYLQESGDQIGGTVEYSTDLFDQATVERLFGHFEALLASAAATPDARVSELALLSAQERDLLVVEWNRTATDYPRSQPIHRLFEEQARLAPDRLAITSGDRTLTYRELDEAANRLARSLRAAGVARQDLVGLLAERSPDAVVGLLGILKAGGAYVPLDPTYPRERLQFILDDTAAKVVVAQPHLLGSLPPTGAAVVPLDSRDPADPHPPGPLAGDAATGDDLAYVLYTSGSTGQPKGVKVPHRGVVRLVRGTDYVDLTSADVFLQFAPLSFDASTFEVWGALLNGAKLAVMPPHNASLEELGEAIQGHGVTVLWLTAPLFHLMVDEALEGLRGVRLLLAGGDVVSPGHARRAVQALPGCRVINGYGPTENTTFTCCWPLDAQAAEVLPEGVPLPIGRPIANTRAYVLDTRRGPVPIGVPGELYVGGDGLALGYLNRPELTAERFVPDPFSSEPGARLYRTGDLVRRRADGAIEFLGRLDTQVKIRGYRIEPGEVESALRTHPQVREAAVVVREDTPGQKALVAYVVADAPAPSGADLRDFLRRKLPEHMVPPAFVALDRMPLTPNGKVDRRALPEPDGLRPDLRAAYAPPTTPAEEVLAEMWADLLKVEQVGVRDNFFELGGHSLLATQVLTRAREAFGVEVPLRTLFEVPTVEGLAAWIVDRLRSTIEAEMAEAAPPPQEPAPSPPPQGPETPAGARELDA